ncbi:conserved Plasmodium protein, unknown function [Plasmodium ovale wallikeri]|uniref:WD repeat-containing protein n=1 Tax=Plasmodium ovale wallikeri TaxID=864142 RepID=A0A1A8YL25_PLAOA|nr:conserved Plasmodium protein, unknown function [Plasmodium ovale wallikeri]SBT32231.1 conserved Plasmodium protein, unknown function [Plasmodium ovale wallikeri]
MPSSLDKMAGTLLLSILAIAFAALMWVILDKKRNTHNTKKESKSKHHRKNQNQKNSNSGSGGKEREILKSKKKAGTGSSKNGSHVKTDMSNPQCSNNGSHVKPDLSNVPHVLFDRYITTLKGNNYPVSVCVNGKYGVAVVSCNNGNLQFHKIEKDSMNKTILTKKIDEVFSCMDMDEDGNRLVAVSELYSTLKIFNIEKSEQNIKNISLTLNGKTELHKKDVKYLYVHKNEYIITGSELEETEVKIWNLQGDLLKVVSIKQVYNNDYAISKTARFFGVACWSPDIKIFEIKVKENSFQNIEKVMDLKTNSGTKCLCFSDDEQKAFLIDKHGVLTTYNLNIRYKLQEESKILYKKDLKEYGFEDFSRMHLSGDSNLLIIIWGCNVLILQQENLQLVNKIMDAHKCEINGVRVIPSSSLFLTWAFILKNKNSNNNQQGVQKEDTEIGVVLGSGGHTFEMLEILKLIKNRNIIFHFFYANNDPLIYLESVCRVYSLSLSAKLLYNFADLFVVFSEHLQKKYKKAKFYGYLF